MGNLRFILTGIFTSLVGILSAGGIVVPEAAGQNLQSDRAVFTQRSWFLRSGFEGRAEGRDDGFASVLWVGGNFEMPFTDIFSIEASPYIAYYSARVQERFRDDTYDGRVGLNYGHLSLVPLNGLTLRAGAISQMHINNSQMISSFRSFPGGFAEYRLWSDQSLSGGLRAQYVIPTSASLNTERQDRETLPTFDTQSLFLDFIEPNYRISAQAGRYSWSAQPAGVAFDSANAGNRAPNTDNVAEARLASGFTGWFGDLEGTYTFDEQEVTAGAKFKRFHNAHAPSNFADSQRASVLGRKDYKEYGFELELGNFFSEADATVARYSSSGFGNTNRKGNFAEARLNLKKYRFFVDARWTQADVISNTSAQDDMTNFSLMVESYAFQF